MFKKFDMKSFVAGGIFALVLTTTLASLATGAMKKNLSVIYNDIKLVVDQKPVSFGKDLGGNQIEPFIYEGTTYLPVRSVGEALDKNVDWDAKTNTVYIGSAPMIKQKTDQEIYLEKLENNSRKLMESTNNKKSSLDIVDYATKVNELSLEKFHYNMLHRPYVVEIDQHTINNCEENIILATYGDTYISRIYWDLEDGSYTSDNALKIKLLVECLDDEVDLSLIQQLLNNPNPKDIEVGEFIVKLDHKQDGGFILDIYVK